MMAQKHQSTLEPFTADVRTRTWADVGRCILAPFICAWYLFGFIYITAQVVFAIQAIIVGNNTYNENECGNEISVWLTVFGCLFLVSCGLGACFGDLQQKKRGQTRRFCDWFLTLLGFFFATWVLHGLTIVYNPGTLRDCNRSQFGVFEFMVLFVFWGWVALVSSFVMFLCIVWPIVAVSERCRSRVDTDQEALVERPGVIIGPSRQGNDIEAQQQQAASSVLQPQRLTTLLRKH